MVRKVYETADAALDGLLFDGMLIAAGGFGVCGVPELLIAAIARAGTKDLAFASNNAGIDGVGIATLISAQRVRRMICSYIGENAEFMRQHLAGSIEVEFNPQGTLAERMRAGGSGIAAFFTRTGAGTDIAAGKPTQAFDGETHVLEEAIRADLAIVRAFRADETGNLVFRKTARNFNPLAAMCGKVCVAEVEEIVPAGGIDPDHVHLPGAYVHRIVRGTHTPRIERLTVRPEESAYALEP